MTWSPPDAPLELLASLPWTESQVALAGAPIDPRAALVVDVGWHGDEIDARLGAFGVARRGGPVEALLGERVRVTNMRAGRSAIVVVHALADDLPDDLTLTRAAMLRVAPLSAEYTRCRVEAVA